MTQYFKNLFKELVNDTDENGKPIIDMDGQIFSSPRDLKDYMIATLTSNMQYDFHINFGRKDVIEFAKALTATKPQDTVKKVIEDLEVIKEVVGDNNTVIAANYHQLDNRGICKVIRKDISLLSKEE